MEIIAFVPDSGHFTIEVNIEELNDIIGWKNAREYDLGFNEAWDMAEKEKER